MHGGYHQGSAASTPAQTGRSAPPPATSTRGRRRAPGLPPAGCPAGTEDASTVMEHLGTRSAAHSRLPYLGGEHRPGFPTGLGESTSPPSCSSLLRFRRGPTGWTSRGSLPDADGLQGRLLSGRMHRCRRRFASSTARLRLRLHVPRALGVRQGLRPYTDVTQARVDVPGYVSAEMLASLGQSFAMPDEAPEVDVGYRGAPAAPLPRAAARMEKHEIGVRFDELAAGRGCAWTSRAEADRLYGDDWYRFLAGCRGMLGVESGVSALRPRGRGSASEYGSRRRRGARSRLDDRGSLALGGPSTTGRSARATSRRPRFRVCQVCSRAATPAPWSRWSTTSR